MVTSAMISILLTMIFAVSVTALEDCSCGYRTDDTSVYTEVIETDFTKVRNVQTLAIDWQIQEWRIEPKPEANVPDCRVAKYENVMAGDRKGLQMLVNAVNGLDVGVSEIRTARQDIKYGSFKVSMQTTKVNGTCSAFFWYNNDAREIDIEILSRELSDGPGQPKMIANMVIHSPESVSNSFDVSKTDSFSKVPMQIDPTIDFHEYRFDWKPKTVDFYVDDAKVCSLAKNIPQVDGRVFINHWSNGSPNWSGGPPTQDAILWVKYVRLYFNSTESARIAAFEKKCQDAKARGEGKICDVSRLNSPFILPPPTTSTITVTSSASMSTSTSTITRSTITTTRALNAATPPTVMGLKSQLTTLVMLVADALLSML